VRDPLEGLSDAGVIRTGADRERVAEVYRAVHDAAIATTREWDPAPSVYAYGSVVTGQAGVPTSDVDLLTIGLEPSAALLISEQLSATFGETCRRVEIAAAAGDDFVGDSDEAYGNRVFLRHYCVWLAGSDVHRPVLDFAGDRRAARGFNGDVGRHMDDWRRRLESGAEPVEDLARRMARKTLLAVAGLVSVHDGTWTTDRRTAADRWSEIVPGHQESVAALLSWSSGATDQPVDVVHGMLDGIVSEIVAEFSALIGLWPDR